MKSWAFVTTPYAWCVPRSRSLVTTNSVWSTQIVVSGRRSSGDGASTNAGSMRSEEHTSELQSPCNLVCRLLLEKKKKIKIEMESDYRHTTKGLLMKEDLQVHPRS